MELPIITIRPPENLPGGEVMKVVLANKGTFLYFVVVMLVTVYTCGKAFATALPIMTQSAVSVQITTDYCPSIEVRTGMPIVWVNLDSVNRALVVVRTSEHGGSVDSVGTRLLRPGDIFSISLMDAGEYTYYCSADHLTSGTITVQK